MDLRAALLAAAVVSAALPGVEDCWNRSYRWSADGRECVAVRVSWQSRVARRFLGRCSKGPPLRRPQPGLPLRLPARPFRFPRCPDARSLSRHLLHGDEAMKTILRTFASLCIAVLTACGGGGGGGGNPAASNAPPPPPPSRPPRWRCPGPRRPPCRLLSRCPNPSRLRRPSRRCPPNRPPRWRCPSPHRPPCRLLSRHPPPSRLRRPSRRPPTSRFRSRYPWRSSPRQWRGLTRRRRS